MEYTIKKWPEKYLTGGKRANLEESVLIPDWFVGYGKDRSCQFEGTWWDMICLAREILASENTKLACPEYYHPEYHIDHYLGGEPYKFTGQVIEKAMNMDSDTYPMGMLQEEWWRCGNY